VPCEYDGISVSNIFVRCCLIESQSSIVPPTFASHGAARCCHQYRQHYCAARVEDVVHRHQTSSSHYCRLQLSMRSRLRSGARRTRRSSRSSPASSRRSRRRRSRSTAPTYRAPSALQQSCSEILVHVQQPSLELRAACCRQSRHRRRTIVINERISKITVPALPDNAHDDDDDDDQQHQPASCSADHRLRCSVSQSIATMCMQSHRQIVLNRINNDHHRCQPLARRLVRRSTDICCRK
jgi:hypothetical protein